MSTLHGFGKTKTLQTEILLEKGYDFSKSLEPNQSVDLQNFYQDLKYLQSYLN